MVQPEFAAAGGALGVIIIDTLASVTPGAVENTSGGLGAAIGALQGIAAETGALVVIVHHAGHNDVGRMRGWSGLPAALDTIIEVAYDKETKFHTASIKKQKDADNSDRVLACFRRRSVDLGLNRRGLPVRGAVVEYENTEEAARRPRLKGDDALMLKAVEAALSNHGARPPVHLLDRIPANVIRRASSRDGKGQINVLVAVRCPNRCPNRSAREAKRGRAQALRTPPKSAYGKRNNPAGSADTA